MCGFSGIVSKSINKSDRVRIMSSLIEHRGPDGEGNYNDDLISLAFRRLAIIDLSKNAMQPMQFNNHIIVFNGEIYNYSKLRTVLEKEKYKFSTRSDTEVLLKGYIHWGVEILNKIRGMFAFAIWNIETESLFLARDNFGKKPLYYSLNNKEFLFCSEINPIQKVLDKKPEILNESVVSYLIKGYYDRSKTIYSNIFTLNAGEYANYDAKNNLLKKKVYWKKSFDVNYNNKKSTTTIDHIEKKIETSIKRRFVSDVPVGICLSGGVDSSLIAIKSSKMIQNKINAYTITYNDQEFDEYKYAKKIVDKTNINSEKILQSNPNLKRIMNSLVNCYGEPFGDDSAIPSYTMFETLKNHGKVFLSGDGADEIFGGYVDAIFFLMKDKLNSFNGITNFVSDDFIMKLIHSSNHINRKLGFIIKTFNSNDRNLFLKLRSTGWSEFILGHFDSDSNYISIFKELEKIESMHFDTLGSNEITKYLNKNLERLSQQFLVKTDRASMFHSVEVRSPYLDVDLYDYVAKLSANDIFNKNKNKYILKKILQKTMGKGFVNRRKMGFTPPLNKWLTSQNNQEWVRKILLDDRLLVREILSIEGIKKLLNENRKSSIHTLRIYRLLFLNYWFKKIYLEI